MRCITARALKEGKTRTYWKHECESALQTFLERLKNAVFYYGTLVGEQLTDAGPSKSSASTSDPHFSGSRVFGESISSESSYCLADVPGADEERSVLLRELRKNGRLCTAEGSHVVASCRSG